MKPTLVTGANGHLGNNLCRLLVARGEPVRAMIRPSADPAPLAGLDLEIVRGDIMDPASTARALEGCGRLYHTAAGFLMWSRDPERDIIRPSVEGTRNVLEGAARAGVEKVLYTSTSGTMGLPTRPDQPFDETRFNREPHTHYLRVKLPVPVLRAVAAAMELASKLTGARPLIDRSQVDEFAGKYGYFDSGKAERELGYTYLPARETVRRTIAWLVARGFVSERRQRALRLDPSLRNPAAA